MSTPQNKGRDELLAAQGIRAELAHWERLVFSFDMDRDAQDPPENAKAQGPSPTSPMPTSGPQSDTAYGVGPSSSIEQALQQLLHSSSYPLALTPLGHPSDPFNPGQAFSQSVPGYYPLPNTPISPLITYADPQLMVNRGENSGNTASHVPPLVATPSPSTTADTSMGEAEAAALAEEKRRRNTTASARFRIRKKQRTVHLERSVSDLKGRAEELEKEVSDLRRENGWLKEIVILKGSQHVAAQRQLAQMLLAQNAGSDLPSGDRGQGNESLGVASSSSAKETTVPEEISSDDSDLEQTEAGAKKQ